MAIEITEKAKSGKKVGKPEQVRIRLAKLNRLGYGKSDTQRSDTGALEARIWEADKHYLVSKEKWETELKDAGGYDHLNRFEPYFELVKDENVTQALAEPPKVQTFRPTEVDVVDLNTGRVIGREAYTAVST